MSVSKLCLLSDIIFAPQESPRTSQQDKKDVSLDSDADRPPTPGKLFSQGADSNVGSANGSKSQGKGESSWNPQKENENSNPKASSSQVAPELDPGGDQPSRASKKEQAEDPVEAGEEASRRESAAKEPKEASALEENTSDVSEVSPLSQGCGQLRPTAAISSALQLPAAHHCCLAPYKFLLPVFVSLSLELHSAVNISHSP